MKNYILILMALALFACGGETTEMNTDSDTEQSTVDSALSAEAQAFLDDYNNQFQELLAASSEAEWASNTRIVEGDTMTGYLTTKANEAMAAFTGSAENIELAQKHLENADKLTELQVRQLNNILYRAGGNPQTVKDIVDAKIAADEQQNTNLFSHKYVLDGKTYSANDIDGILNTSTDLDERLAIWELSKTVGIGLKDGLANLQDLRNQSVQALGYSDFFHYQVSDYGMTSDEMLELCQNMINDIWPLYRELHTWARYDLAEQYGTEVPELLPAHWLPNRWGQDWTGLVEVEGLDVDAALEQYDGEWIAQQGEEFYMSLGFEELPESFWELSSLYPAPEGADYSKNNHASAWHMNNDQDVRSLMSIIPNTDWWGTALHEYGHIYYFLEYSNDDVPIILREGANRGYHEAMGSLLGLAALQQPFLEGRGLLEPGLEVDEIQVLLKEALDFVVLLPWGAGVMTEFEYELYANDLPIDEFNAKWWELKAKYQGISAPGDRSDELGFCDAASKTHINNDPAQYYDYAISNILLFQFHDHISKNILGQDPHATNYWGNKEVGEFLASLMYPGATVDWEQHLIDHIGTGMSAKPMLEYFEPLMEWLKKENEGRTHTLPESL